MHTHTHDANNETRERCLLTISRMGLAIFYICAKSARASGWSCRFVVVVAQHKTYRVTLIYIDILDELRDNERPSQKDTPGRRRGIAIPIVARKHSTAECIYTALYTCARSARAVPECAVQYFQTASNGSVVTSLPNSIVIANIIWLSAYI